MSCALICASLAAPALALAAVNSTARYLEADFQQIFRTVLETRPPVFAPQPLVFPEGPCERPLKAKFPELYCDKTYMECYNFIQQCEDHFAIARAKKPNRMPFGASFLQKQALLRWQQHKAKNTIETNVSFTWEEFKAFLCRSLGKSQAFGDNIWRTIRKDFHYQQKEVMDWAAHLEHLQIVLREFNSAAAPNKKVLICYFCDGLRPSIQAQTDERGQDLDTWEEAIKKSINAKAKTACQPQSLMREMDNWCPRGHRPVKFDEPTKESKNLDKNSSRPQKPKTQAPLRSDNAETSEKAWKEKKNDRQHQRGHRASQDRKPQEGSTPATEVNNTLTSGGGNSRKNQNKGSR